MTRQNSSRPSNNGARLVGSGVVNALCDHGVVPYLSDKAKLEVLRGLCSRNGSEETECTALP